MGKTAFIFPGQGAQYFGMGKDFFDKYEDSKKYFEEASKILGFDMEKMCFEENEDLNNTQYTQAAMFTVCAAILQQIEKTGVKPDVCAGLSLGEYAALYSCGTITFEDAVYLLRKRGMFMDEEVPDGKGTMAAVLGMDADKIDDICKNTEGEVAVANYNCPGQIVITGETDAVERASKTLAENVAKRVLPLKVSGPFHSAMLKGAGDKLEKELKNVEFKELKMPYVANCNASYIYDNSQIKELLKKQISSPVKFMQSVEKMIDDGVDTFVEIGPGKTLSKFVKKINKDVTVINIEKVDDLEKLKGLEIC